MKVNGWQRNSCKDCSDSKGEYFCSNAQKCTSKTVCNVPQGPDAAEAAAAITATASTATVAMATTTAAATLAVTGCSASASATRSAPLPLPPQTQAVVNADTGGTVGLVEAKLVADDEAEAPNITLAAESEEIRWTKNDPTLLDRLHAALEPMLPSRAGGQANREHRAPEQDQAVWDYNYDNQESEPEVHRLEGNPGTTPECCPEPPSTRVFPPVYTTEHPERHLWRQSLVMRLKEMAHAWDDLATTADTDNLETQRSALLKVFFVAPGADDLIKEVAAFVHPCI